MLKALTFVAFALATFATTSTAADDRYDPDAAMQISQSAIGRQIGDYELLDRFGRSVNIRSDHSGRPLVISMIFTSCHHVCPTTTKHLDDAVDAAREALGDDSFDVLTIGFDVANDSPQAMAAYARRQGVTDSGWQFLSASRETIDALSEDLGFIYFPTARGFDHMNQTTVIDRDGVVYSQVYGVTFELPWLVEPLKDLVFNRPSSAGHLFAGIVDRVKLFCTVYDPTTGRYRFDNSLFVQIAVGASCVLATILYLFRELWLRRRLRKAS